MSWLYVITNFGYLGGLFCPTAPGGTLDFKGGGFFKRIDPVIIEEHLVFYAGQVYRCFDDEKIVTGAAQNCEELGE